MAQKIISIIGEPMLRAYSVSFLSDLKYTNIKIKDPIIKSAQTIFGFTDEQMGAPNENVQLHDGTVISPNSAIKFLMVDVFENNAHYYIPGLNGRTFWTKMLINKLITSPRKYVIDDVERLSDYYEIKKYFPDSLFIKISHPTHPHYCAGEYIPNDIEINFKDFDHLCNRLKDVDKILD